MKTGNYLAIINSFKDQNLQTFISIDSWVLRIVTLEDKRSQKD